MPIIATDSTRFSGLIKREFDPATGYCREEGVVNDVANTLNVGSVMGAYLTSPVGTASPTVGTGNGTMGSIVITSNQFTPLGLSTVVFTSATAFNLYTSSGRILGSGVAGTAYSQNGVAFLITVGATPFVAGDQIVLTVSGVVKYRYMTQTALDGSQVAAGLLIADTLGLAHPTVIVASTDTKVLLASRGPIIVNKSSLQFDVSVTAAQQLIAIAQLKQLGIISEVQN